MIFDFWGTILESNTIQESVILVRSERERELGYGSDFFYYTPTTNDSVSYLETESGPGNTETLFLKERERELGLVLGK